MTRIPLTNADAYLGWSICRSPGLRDFCSARQHSNIQLARGPFAPLLDTFLAVSAHYTVAAKHHLLFHAPRHSLRKHFCRKRWCRNVGVRSNKGAQCEIDAALQHLATATVAASASSGGLERPSLEHHRLHRDCQVAAAPPHLLIVNARVLERSAAMPSSTSLGLGGGRLPLERMRIFAGRTAARQLGPLLLASPPPRPAMLRPRRQ